MNAHFRSYCDLDEILASRGVDQSVIGGLVFAQKNTQRARNTLYTKQIISEGTFNANAITQRVTNLFAGISIFNC